MDDIVKEDAVKTDAIKKAPGANSAGNFATDGDPPRRSTCGRCDLYE
jgi:hypothetical protein